MASVDENALAKFLSRVADKLDEEVAKQEKNAEKPRMKSLKQEAAAALDLDLEDFTLEVGTRPGGLLDLSSNAASGSEIPSGSAPQTHGDTLEDLMVGLKQNINTSNTWLGDNTAGKWMEKNPELAEEYKKAMVQDEKKEY